MNPQKGKRLFLLPASLAPAGCNVNRCAFLVRELVNSHAKPQSRKEGEVLHASIRLVVIYKVELKDHCDVESPISLICDFAALRENLYSCRID